jgi:putative sterol carrier protein
MVAESVEEVFVRMPERFRLAKSKGLDAVFQFVITGAGGGSWFVTVKDSACQVTEGVHDAPKVTLRLSSATWLDMVNKRLSGMQAFMTGKLDVTGDLMLAQRIPDLFDF